MFVFGPLDRPLDCEPIADHLDVAERNAGLHHAEVSGVHADDEHAMLAAPIALQIFAMRRPRVGKRVVNVTDQSSEAKLRNVVPKPPGDGDQCRCCRHGVKRRVIFGRRACPNENALGTF